MKKSSLGLILVLVAILLLAGCGCNSYNSLVTGNNSVQKAWSNVEANYQRRTDLYNSVVKTIQGSANFEKSTLTAVIEARAKATSVHVDVNDSSSISQYQAAQGQLQSAFGRLLAVAEAYPQLQTTQAFRDFQAQIEGTENRINISRRDYNDVVTDFNNQVQHFPNNIFAGLFHFQAKPYYKADVGSEKAPDINFDIK